MDTHGDEKKSSPRPDLNRNADPGMDGTASGHSSPAVEGDAVERVPSQSERMGKRQIALIIGALCVCGSLHKSHWDFPTGMDMVL
jgi:hypothetical protein